jgi:hypothetical protein
MFKVVKTGKKTAKKSWKRMITKPTFVGPDFTRRPVKYERFIEIQEGECYPYGVGCYGPASDHQCQEESAESDVYTVGCFDKGNGH